MPAWLCLLTPAIDPLMLQRLLHIRMEAVSLTTLSLAKINDKNGFYIAQLPESEEVSNKAMQRLKLFSGHMNIIMVQDQNDLVSNVITEMTILHVITTTSKGYANQTSCEILSPPQTTWNDLNGVLTTIDTAQQYSHRTATTLSTDRGPTSAELIIVSSIKANKLVSLSRNTVTQSTCTDAITTQSAASIVTVQSVTSMNSTSSNINVIPINSNKVVVKRPWEIKSTLKLKKKTTAKPRNARQLDYYSALVFTYDEDY